MPAGRSRIRSLARSRFEVVSCTRSFLDPVLRLKPADQGLCGSSGKRNRVFACSAESVPQLTGSFVLKFPGASDSRLAIWHYQSGAIDFPLRRSNNPPMPRPEAVRRVKSYSAANGFVYQYLFFEVNRVTDENGATGEFLYAVTSDRKTTFGVRILVRQSVLQDWAGRNGRPLTSSEEYAVAKMRLFQGFDAGEVPPNTEADGAITLVVDGSNLEALLQALNI